MVVKERESINPANLHAYGRFLAIEYYPVGDETRTAARLRKRYEAYHLARS